MPAGGGPHLPPSTLAPSCHRNPFPVRNVGRGAALHSRFRARPPYSTQILMDLSGSKRPSAVEAGGEEEQGGEEEAMHLCRSGASNSTQKDVFLIGLFSASAALSVSAANGLSRRSNLYRRVQIQQSATCDLASGVPPRLQRTPVLPVILLELHYYTCRTA